MKYRYSAQSWVCGSSIMSSGFKTGRSTCTKGSSHPSAMPSWLTAMYAGAFGSGLSGSGVPQGCLWISFSYFLPTIVASIYWELCPLICAPSPLVKGALYSSGGSAGSASLPAGPICDSMAAASSSARCEPSMTRRPSRSVSSTPLLPPTL